MSDSIKVAIKVRPLIKREKDENQTIQWIVQGNTIVSIDPEMKKRGDGGFCFDHIFDTNASNLDVFTTVVKPIVDAAVNGINGTVFAYGQTSSGKTYSMLGTSQEPGIIPLAIDYMFDAIANTAGREFLLRVSYLELYNERVNDLLNKSNTDLKLKEDGCGQIVLQCKEEITNCPENVLSLMKKGDKIRRIGETNMNERSSRSHTIFRITIESREAEGDSDAAIQVSQLNLVDLAGSERARQTGATGERFKEGRHINMSLSTLGLVIMQLSESQDSQKHVNFRDSKLTRLLQSSLGGNAMTTIICAVTPAALEETQCTLSFASRAKSVKNKPQINEVMSDGALLKRYAKQLSKLEAELQRIKTENRVAEVEEMESKLQEKDRINQLLEERIELLKTRIVSGDTTNHETFNYKSKRRQTWGGRGMFSHHLPIFQPTADVPTIRAMSCKKSHRKSIIQSVDITNQTFQTAFTDFELELFESERDRENEAATDSDDESFVTKRKYRVTFEDDVLSIKSKDNITLEKSNLTISSEKSNLNVSPEKSNLNVTSEISNLYVSPERCNTATQTMSYHASPSTPKHILRKCIEDLTKEYVELRQFTALEKQLVCQENHYCAHEKESNLEKLKANSKAENVEVMAKITEFKKSSEDFRSEKDKFEQIDADLRDAISQMSTELELKIMSEQAATHEPVVKVSELEKRIEQIASERYELERINAELRAELISEQTANADVTKKVFELGTCIEDITSERNEFKRINVELRAELVSEQTASSEVTQKVSELEKRVEDIASERNEFERINIELRTELVSKQTANEEVTTKVSELGKHIEKLASERNEFERINAELRAELVSEQTASAEMTKKISELEKCVEEIALERNEFERINIELKTKLVSERTANEEVTEVSVIGKHNEKLASERNEFERINAELRAELVLEQNASAEVTKKISELEKCVEEIALERNEFERINIELKTKLVSERTANEEVTEISEIGKHNEKLASERNEFERINAELRAELVLEQNASAEVTKKISELEKRVEEIASERNEFERINIELRTELVSKQTANEEVTTKVSELGKHIEKLASERNEFERINAELRAELVSEQTASSEMMQKVSELEKRVENIASERNEFERINIELRAKLVSKQTASSEVTKVSVLEKRIEEIISERNEFGCINDELRAELVLEQTASAEMTKKISELEKCVEEIALERNEFERINIELKTKLVSERTANEEVTEVSVIGKHNEKLASERNEFERINAELRAELVLEQNASAEVTKKISELEKCVEEIALERNEFERINIELKTKLVSERTANEEVTEVSVIGKHNEKLASERNEFERINAELRAELVLEQNTSAEMTKKISDLEEKIKNITIQKKELEHLNIELNMKVTELESTVISEQIVRQKVIENNSELHKEIGNINDEKNELERTNIALNQKTCKLESKVISEQRVNLEAMETICKLKRQIGDITSEMKGLEDVSCKLHDEQCETISEIKFENSMKDVQDIITNIKTENQVLKHQVQNQSLPSYASFDESNTDTSALMINVDLEKNQLEENIQLKSRELNEIKSNVQSLKQDIQNLQETIYLLTTENMEMATKLTTEQENAKQAELNLQNTIDELYARIAEVTIEKINLQSNLAASIDQLESMRPRLLEVRNEEQLFATYQNKIDKLRVENIELSTSIAEKNNELESTKESKSLLYDHECIYKEEITILVQKNGSLQLENDELSIDLMDKIEENDSLREECDILKSKMEQFQAMNENTTGNDIDHLRSLNNILKAEISELKIKMTILSEENTKFSNNLLETLENRDYSHSEKSGNNTLCLSTIFSGNIETTDYIGQDILQKENREVLASKVTTLQEKINYLTRLNKKLSDLKLTSCSQCAHLRNLNESRWAFKFEAKALNQKLEDLQKKFDRKCADTEMLKNQISRELNLSGRDVSANISFVDEMNVSFVEERIQNLNDELQTLKVDHDKLSVLYKDKCNELEELQLQEGKITAAQNIESASKKCSSKNGHRIDQIQNHIDLLRNDIHELKKRSMNFTVMLNQFENEKANLSDEINSLKASNEELRQKVSSNESTAVEKIRVLENELTNMSSEIQQFLTREKEFERQRLISEVELEELKAKEQNKNTLINQLNERIFSLKNELDLLMSQKNELTISNTTENKCKEEIEQQGIIRIKELEACIDNLQTNMTKQECLCGELQEKCFYTEKCLHESEEAKCILIQKLQVAKTELIDSKSSLEIKYKNEFESMSLQYERRIEEFESNIQKLNDTLNKYVDENLSLTQELTRLHNIKEKYDAMMMENERVFSNEKLLVNDNEKLGASLNDIRNCITKELRSLKCNTISEDFSDKSVNEIFIILLQTLVSKEEEMVKSMRETFEKDKQKLVDEKQQSADTEKRAMIWARELEVEIEKLQTEIMERERAHKEYQNKIAQLEHLLRESTHENNIFKENVKTLEADFNNLQAEFDKQCKVDSQQGEAIIIAQKKEKEAQETLKNKEIELQLQAKSEQKMYEKKINDLVYTIESYKTKNLELNNTVEGLEANEKQLKNIIQANSIKIKKYKQNMEEMNAELEQLREAYNELNKQMERKTMHIEEITAILKNKCDMLSEYNIKLETIMPEYEVLKEHIKDKKSTIERYKQEIEMLKKEREAQLKIIKDKLDSEEIKSAGLKKQLNELQNKNIALIDKLNELKGKYEELQQTNAKLERKIRNSTSKIKVETEIEELKETNRRLQNNLEGASNRVTELQDVKNQTLKELVDIKGKYELLLQENAETKKTLHMSKHRTSSSSIDEGKYNAILLEKNQIALELEEKKLLLNQKSNELKEYASQIQQLTDENKELDDELEEYAAKIQEQDSELSKLEDKLHSRLTENAHINELREKLKSVNEENEKLQDQVDALKMRLQINMEQTEDIKTRQSENVIHALKKENLELETRINNYKKLVESTKRELKTVMSNKDFNEYEEKCQRLRAKIHELELQLVSKNGKIATLEIQIQSENFPYQRKCKELEEHLLAFRTKNAELNFEIRKLKRTINDVNAWECDVCRHWRVNRKDQGCQTIPNSIIRFCSINSGVVEDHAKIQKLEKEKALMKGLCRSRSQRIKELEDRIKELEKT